MYGKILRSGKKSLWITPATVLIMTTLFSIALGWYSAYVYSWVIAKAIVKRKAEKIEAVEE